MAACHGEAAEKAPGASSLPRGAVRFETARGPWVVRVEVVSDDASRSRGLMFRRELDPDHGMLFVFPSSEEHTFWMHDTDLASPGKIRSRGMGVSCIQKVCSALEGKTKSIPWSGSSSRRNIRPRDREASSLATSTFTTQGPRAVSKRTAPRGREEALGAFSAASP